MTERTSIRYICSYLALKSFCFKKMKMNNPTECKTVSNTGFVNAIPSPDRCRGAFIQPVGFLKSLSIHVILN